MIPAGSVRSVLGDVVADPASGAALVHEHISSDLSARSGPAFLLDDCELAVAEVNAAAADGVSLIIDTSNSGHRRDPLFLRDCAQRTAVTIVASTGHYRAGFYPPAVAAGSVAALADRMIADITTGIADGPVRAGAIAEIGSSGDAPVGDEEKVLRAAGLAQAATGAPLLTHTAEGHGWQHQLDLLSEAGADLGRVVIGHMDCTDDGAAQRAIIKRGAWLGFDRVGLTSYQPDEVRCRMLMSLHRDGLLGRVLLSSDIATKERFRWSGSPGYAGVLTRFAPMLAAAGMDADAITMLVMDNPWRFLAGR